MASAKKFLGRGRYRPRPKIPRIPGRPKENSNYCKCAHEICLTAGVHLSIPRPFCVLFALAMKQSLRQRWVLLRPAFHARKV